MNLQEQKWLVLLYTLTELGGGGQRKEVLQYIQDNNFWYKNDENDIIRETRNEKAWRNDFSFERQHLVSKGYMKACANGQWLISKEGTNKLNDLVNKAHFISKNQEPCFTSNFYARLFPYNSDENLLADMILIGVLSNEEEDITETGGTQSNAFTPQPVGSTVQFFGRTVKRNPNAAQKALFNAKNLCEIDAKHPSFLRKNKKNMYMEPHHLIPLSMTCYFNVNLDREENIFSLCSNCHNQIHYGTKEDVRRLISKLFYSRQDKICAILGRTIELEELLRLYGV